MDAVPDTRYGSDAIGSAERPGVLTMGYDGVRPSDADAGESLQTGCRSSVDVDGLGAIPGNYRGGVHAGRRRTRAGRLHAIADGWDAVVGGVGYAGGQIDPLQVRSIGWAARQLQHIVHPLIGPHCIDARVGHRPRDVHLEDWLRIGSGLIGTGLIVGSSAVGNRLGRVRHRRRGRRDNPDCTGRVGCVGTNDDPGDNGQQGHRQQT